MRSRFYLSVALYAMLAACGPSQVQTTAVKTDDASSQKARQLQESGDISGAEHIYRELIALQTPQTATLTPYIELAALYRKQERHADAVAVLQQANTMQPNNPQLLRPLGYALSAAGKAEEAVSIFDQWIALEPNNARAYDGKAVAFDHSGNHLAAQELYEHALVLAPADPDIRNNDGLSLILSGKLEEAIAVLEPLAQQPAATATMRQNLALAYGLHGDDNKALAIGMQDLKVEQAQENIRFYQQERQHLAAAPQSRLTGTVTPVSPAASGNEIAPAPQITIEKPPGLVPIVSMPEAAEPPLEKAVKEAPKISAAESESTPDIPAPAVDPPVYLYPSVKTH